MGLSGCGPYPPNVSTRAEINRLPTSTRSLYARSLPDSDIPALLRLRALKLLNFEPGFARKDITTGFKRWDAAISDTGLEELSSIELPNLECLGLGNCDRITDAGLVHVAKMRSITSLHLPSCPRITDAGLLHLLSMNKLTALTLEDCSGITDIGLRHLEGKANWQLIRLGGCPNITPTGVAQLRAALPNTKIDLRTE
jgi:Leucine Rich repeat